MPSSRHSLIALLWIMAVCSSYARAFEIELGPTPISLKHLPVPEVPGLLDGPNRIVVNKNAAIALGKALFWDTNVGSDGMACASCHFSAGSDGRVKNQVAAGGSSTLPADQTFSNSADGSSLGPNHVLSEIDFPLHQRQDPFNDHSPTVRDTHNVVGSSGTFSGELLAVNRSGSGNDQCSRSADPVFHAGSVGTRRVTPRNAPSVINAIFNHRNFWDGRANNVFNGSSSWGDRDPSAGVWVKTGAKTITKQRLHLINSSLASLAVAPPLNTTEMGCHNRTMMEVGRKLLLRQPLENQKVHPEDSVLAPYSLSEKDDIKPGLNLQYQTLIKQAFNNKYWSYTGRVPAATKPGQIAYNQLEANFALFFGLSIQLYESTLISDETPFDQSPVDNEHLPTALSAAELRGLKQFRKNQCAVCHLGPHFSSAAVNANAAIAQTHPEAFGQPTFTISTSTNVVDRIPIFNGTAVTAFYDTGYAATGVAAQSDDIGLANVDDFGHPLAFSAQYLQHLAGRDSQVYDQDVSKVRACDFQEEFTVNFIPRYFAPSTFTPATGIRPQPQDTAHCYLNASFNAFLPTLSAALAELNNPGSQKMQLANQAAFKIPSLRNIELTGPYMHNGSMATLEQVIEFYSRGGNFTGEAKQITRVFSQPNLQLNEQNRQDLIAFLKTLTDERVRYQRAPFDHPEIKIPHGHSGDEQTLVSGNRLTTPVKVNLDKEDDGNPLSGELAQDEYLTIEAVGADGSSAAVVPFQDKLAP